MIISGIREERAEGVVRAAATVAWEDSDQKPLSLFVETEERFAADLVADPNAFLVACLLPAWRSGEARVRVEGVLCPVLRERVKVPLGMIRRWHPDEVASTPAIEPAGGYRLRRAVGRKSLAMLSCGIDSLATLRWNCLTYPRDHPDAVTASVFVAYDDDVTPSVERLRRFTAPRADAVRAVAVDAGTTPIPVRTNMWWLAPDGYFFTEKWHGAVLASVASFFSGGFRQAYVASSHNPDVLEPYGSHPLLDPYFSSAHFRVEHDLFSMSRSEKVALVADWPVALANIRVCTNDTEGGPNCGTCEKCIRTQVQMAALGKLEAAAPSFPRVTLTPGLIATIDDYDMIRGHPYYIAWYSQAVDGLRAQGLADLSDALRRVVDAATAEPTIG